MTQAAQAFQYDVTPATQQEKGGAAGSISIFSDRGGLRSRLCDHALESGLVVRQSEDLARLHSGDALVLGDIALVDAPIVDGALLAALAHLDICAARSSSQLIVSTSSESLDCVFGVLDQCGAQILVEPDDADRAMALGSALARLPHGAVNELSGEDRLALIRLTEQVQMLARKMEGLYGRDDTEGVDRQDDGRSVRSPALSYMASETVTPLRAVRAPHFPKSALVREIIRQRHLRTQFFDAALFADPAWDILLDLTAAKAEGKQVSVSSLCIASGVPPTTALRWITQMTDTGLLERVQDRGDRRRAFIALSAKAAAAMAAYFQRLDTGAAIV